MNSLRKNTFSGEIRVSSHGNPTIIIMEKRKETRLTVVMDGRRLLEFFDIEIEEDIQDEGRTIKLFLKKNGKKS